MPRKKLTPRELARQMVVVSKRKEDDWWSIMVADRARKEEVTRMSFLDFLERGEAIRIARLIRRAIVDALEQAAAVRVSERRKQKTVDGWLVTMKPPFSEIRATRRKRRKRKSSRSKARSGRRDSAEGRAGAGAREGRVLAFSTPKARS